jgi:hypothetical protein
MTIDMAMFYAVLTWPACAVIFFIAVCRINAMPPNTFFRVVVEYAIWAAVGFCVPLLPLIGEWPGLGMVVMLYGLVVVLLCSARAWAGDNAPDEATDSMPLHSFDRRGLASKWAALVEFIRRA